MYPFDPKSSARKAVLAVLKEDSKKMRTRSVARVVLYGLLALVIVSVGCKHPAPVTPAAAPTPPAPPAQPTVTLQANPPTVQRGQSSTLRWTSTNATSLTIAPNVGTVSPEGTSSVTPNDSVTYTITATGPGGSANASARVTVNAPPPPPAPVAAAPSPTMEELFLREVMDAYFDFDKANVRADAQAALMKTGDFLRNYPQVKVTIEGHCDERGSTEYNLALGDRRAQAAKDYLVSLGVASDRMTTVSYGKERPFCTEHAEQCWQQNRRAHFTMAK
jgi:peptidoglycan-associated lipoprotein